MEQYTFFTQNRGDILLVGYEKGQKKVVRRKIKPYLFIDDPKAKDYKTYKGSPVKRIDFSSVKEARDFVEEYEEIDNVDIHGSTYYDYVYINDYFKTVKTNTAKIKYGNIDIETDSEGGYADVELADKEITSFQIKVMGSKKVYVLGLQKFNEADSEKIMEVNAPGYDVIYHYFKNEKLMLQAFIALWRRLDFDLVTGWNIEAYDIPYIIRRITRVFDENEVKRLSPFKMIKSRKFINDFHKEQEIFEIVGVPAIDYMQAYKKFSFKNQESFTLDYISHVELDKKKLDYSEYRTLANLYKENPAMFYAYGAIDIIRIDELEEKLRYLDLIVTLAHFTKTNLLDGFATVKPVDVYIHNMLMEKKKVVPFIKKEDGIHRKIAGGYVKEPLIGLHSNVMSFDFTSLYPHLIMCFNISPDTYLGKIDKYDSLSNIPKIMMGGYKSINERILEKNITITAKGTIFTKKYKGFLCEMMEVGFDLRKKYKDEMIRYKKIDEKHPLVSSFNAMQMAVKIFLNSVYGSIANPWSRWFSYDIAESITMCGQLASKMVERDINTNLADKTGLEKDFIIAVDTDSCYVDISDLADENTSKEEYIDISKYISGIIDGACEDIYKTCNVYQPKLHMKLECIGKALWRGGKNYAMLIWYDEGVIYDTPKVKMLGIEAVKSTTPEICRKKIKECIPLIIQGKQKELIKMVDDFRDYFYNQPFHVVGKTTGIKGIEKYEHATSGVPYHVKASVAFNKHLKKLNIDKVYPPIASGDKIKLCYLVQPNKFGIKVLAAPGELPSEFDVSDSIDYRKQFDKVFLSPIKSLTDVAKIDLSGKGDINEFY